MVIHNDLEIANKEKKIFENQIEDLKDKIKILQDEIFSLTLSKNDLQKDKDLFKEVSQNFENAFKENERLLNENAFLKKENDELRFSISKPLKENVNLETSFVSQRSLCIKHESTCDHPSTSSCTTTFTRAKHDRTQASSHKHKDAKRMHVHNKDKSNHAFMYKPIASKNQPSHGNVHKKHHSFKNYHLKHKNDVPKAKDCKRHNSRNTCAFQGFCNYCHAYGHKAYFCNSWKRTYHASPHRNRINMSFNKCCFYCGDFGHVSYKCAIKSEKSKTKLVWVPKGTCTNIQGPKYLWVPKVPN